MFVLHTLFTPFLSCAVIDGEDQEYRVALRYLLCATIDSDVLPVRDLDTSYHLP